MQVCKPYLFAKAVAYNGGYFAKFVIILYKFCILLNKKYKKIHEKYCSFITKYL